MFVRIAQMIVTRANRNAWDKIRKDHSELSSNVMREFKKATGYTQGAQEHLDCLDFIVKNNLSEDIRKGITAYYGSTDPLYVRYLCW